MAVADTALERAARRSRRGVLEPDHDIPGCRRDQLAVRRERDHVDPTLMALERAARLANPQEKRGGPTPESLSVRADNAAQPFVSTSSRGKRRGDDITQSFESSKIFS